MKPSSHYKVKSLPSERRIIEDIRRRMVESNHFNLSDKHKNGLVKGIGDDCAVFSKSKNMLELATTDTLVESIHFDLAWHPPFMLGRKAASVNISDIAAMGGIPRYALLSIGLPAATDAGWLEEFIAGFTSVLDENDTILAGGDTVQSRELMFSVTILGEVGPKEILYRDKACVEDLVWVSGMLGNAAAGLALCQNQAAVPVGQAWEPLCRAHLDPASQVEIAGVLAKSGMVRAMMDLSDGLATDLAHLCQESGVGALVEAKHLPVSEPLRQAADYLKCDPMEWVIAGGEDYQLLFTTPPETEEKLSHLVQEQTGRAIYPIGSIVETSGVYLLSPDGRREEVTFRGYDHFVA